MRVRPPLRPLLFSGASSCMVPHIFATDKTSGDSLRRRAHAGGVLHRVAPRTHGIASCALALSGAVVGTGGGQYHGHGVQHFPTSHHGVRLLPGEQMTIGVHRQRNGGVPHDGKLVLSSRRILFLMLHKDGQIVVTVSKSMTLPAAHRLVENQ